MDELLPCPFCGGEADFLSGGTVKCKKCGGMNANKCDKCAFSNGDFCKIEKFISKYS